MNIWVYINEREQSTLFQNTVVLYSNSSSLMESQQNFPLTAVAAAPNDILSWTNQDARESLLFNSWGILYRFQVCIR